MEALGGLAAAARDICALRTARADSCPRSDSPLARAHLALPVRQGRFLWDRLSDVPRRDGLWDQIFLADWKGEGRWRW